jgi:hypothetical protein
MQNQQGNVENRICDSRELNREFSTATHARNTAKKLQELYRYASNHPITFIPLPEEDAVDETAKALKLIDLPVDLLEFLSGIPCVQKLRAEKARCFIGGINLLQ